MPKPYISVVHNPDGTKTVKDHASKKEAHEEGRKARSEGKDVAVHNKEDARRLGLDPRDKRPEHIRAQENAIGIKQHLKAFARKLGSSGDERSRDEDGKFN